MAAAGSIFTGLNFSFDNGAQFYNVDAPDRINPLGGATAALNYSAGTGAAGIQYTDAGNGAQLVMLAFPFETITTAANRAAVMERVVQYFQLAELPTEIEVILDNDNGPSVYTETGSWQTSGLPGYNGTTFRYASPGSASTAQWQFTAPFAGQAEVFVQYLASAAARPTPCMKSTPARASRRRASTKRPIASPGCRWGRTSSSRACERSRSTRSSAPRPTR